MEFLDVELFNQRDLFKLFIRFLIDFSFTFVIIRVLYFAANRRKDYLFTFFIFNLLTFFICFLLRKVPMELGFALGLFAVFGILRYRTEPIPIKEMTYLFIVIGLAMINALANKKISWAELMFVNSTILLVTLSFEKLWFNNEVQTKNIVYERIDLIKTKNRLEMIRDLRERTGLDIVKVQIGKIDFLRDVATVTIFFKADVNEVVWGTELTQNEE
ncbi:MAG: hypothetical protein ACI9B2_000525 [Flavobacteriales bacterium]|jgi:hypothetical protein|tara:strand:- start:1373 stop:2020 length:648 start_codon:yes stop_codon:yes gene_type:complete